MVQDRASVATARRFYSEKNLQNLCPIFLVLLTTVAVSVAWRENHMSPRVMCVIRALIVAFKSSVLLT